MCYDIHFPSLALLVHPVFTWLTDLGTLLSRAS